MLFQENLPLLVDGQEKRVFLGLDALGRGLGQIDVHALGHHRGGDQAVTGPRVPTEPAYCSELCHPLRRGQGHRARVPGGLSAWVPVLEWRRPSRTKWTGGCPLRSGGSVKLASPTVVDTLGLGAEGRGRRRLTTFGREAVAPMKAKLASSSTRPLGRPDYPEPCKQAALPVDHQPRGGAGAMERRRWSRRGHPRGGRHRGA